MYSRTVVTGETHTFEGVVNSRTESFKGRVKYTLWQGDKLVEQFPSYYFECKGKNFFNTLAIPCFVTVVPGTYRLKMLLKEEGKNNLLIYSNRTFTAKFKLIKFIAVGGNGYIISPPKTQQVSTNTWAFVSYENGKYLTASWQGYVSTSTDGTTWSVPVQVGTKNNSWSCITYGNGKYIMGSVYGYITTSTDGKNWTSLVKLDDSIIDVVEIIYINNKFIALAKLNSSGYLFTSTDGTSWNKLSAIGSYYYWESLIYAGGKYVVTGSIFSSVPSGAIATSIDGVKWNIVKVGIGDYQWNDVAYGNGRYVAVDNTGSIALSDDGETWRVQSSNVPGLRGRSISSIIYMNGVFLALVKSGQIITSADGETWYLLEQLKDHDSNIITANFYDFCLLH